MLIPGADGDPLPDAETILRIGNEKALTNDGKVNPEAFVLSGEDKAAAVPRLSVWAEGLTTPDEAWRLMGAQEKHCVVIRLNVGQVCGITAEHQGFRTPNLKVVWERATTLDQDRGVVPLSGPGADGHSGIENLHIELSGVPPFISRTLRKSMRLQLADLAQGCCSYLPHYRDPRGSQGS